MSNKKNPGEAADVGDMPDGDYEVYNDLEGVIDLTGVGYKEKDKVYPILILVQWCHDESFRFLRIKPEDIRWSKILLYDIKKGDCLSIKKGKIIRIKD